MEGSHWVQLDNPVEFNEAVREWLQDVIPVLEGKSRRTSVDESHVGRAPDEL